MSVLVEDLGSTVLSLLAAPAGSDPVVQAAEFYEPRCDLELSPSCAVLAPGIGDAAEMGAVLSRLASMRAAALLVMGPVRVTAALARAVDDAGVALVEVAPGASWFQVAGLLRERMGTGVIRSSTSGLEANRHDLFDLANAISALIDAPVTIEEPDSRVLAFSRDQEDTDPARIATVLGQVVPERYRALLEERDLFTQLFRSRRPLYLELGADVMPRVAVAIRSGEEILGSMWAAVPGPLDSQREKAFADAANVVSLALLQKRAGADAGRRLRADLLATLVSGQPAAVEARVRLGLAGVTLRVLAVSAREHWAPEHQAEAQGVADALSVHLAAFHPSSAAALVDGVVYGVLPLPASRIRGDTVQHIAESFLRRLGRTGRHPDVIVGIGRRAEDPDGFVRSRRDADRVLRVLRARVGGDRVAVVDDGLLGAILVEIRDFLQAEALPVGSGVVGELQRYDAENQSDLLSTLHAYFETFGDVNAVARMLHVHPNTVRYRFRRVCEVSGFDPEDPDASLEAWLQIKLLRDFPERN